MLILLKTIQEATDSSLYLPEGPSQSILGSKKYFDWEIEFAAWLVGDGGFGLATRSFTLIWFEFGFSFLLFHCTILAGKGRETYC